MPFALAMRPLNLENMLHISILHMIREASRQRYFGAVWGVGSGLAGEFSNPQLAGWRGRRERRARLIYSTRPALCLCVSHEGAAASAAHKVKE